MSLFRRLVVLAALLGVGFGLLFALHVHLGDAAVVRFDWGGLVWVHGFARPWLTFLMRGLTLVGRVKVFGPVLAVAVLVLGLKGRVREAWVLGGPMVAALVLNEGLKVFFHRGRPGVAWSVGDERTFSYPSGHALFAMVLYGGLVYLLGRRWGWLGVMVVGIGVSRVYLGMHFPTDVLAGWGVGVFVLAGVWVVDGLGGGFGGEGNRNGKCRGPSLRSG